MITQIKDKNKYHPPDIVLIACYVEDPICSASATLTIGEPGQEYSPDIADWETGSSGQSYYEF